MRFSPAMSTTEYSIAMSRVPTYGRVSPDATVETSIFGTPTGNARMALALMQPMARERSRDFLWLMNYADVLERTGIEPFKESAYATSD